MTSFQRRSLDVLLSILKPSEVHHGDCVGADEQFHVMCMERHIHVIIHPPDNDVLRAHSIGGFSLAPRPYLERNKDIINLSDMLIAAPKGPEVQQGSGTWQSIRWVRRLEKPVIIIHPEGYLERR